MLGYKKNISLEILRLHIRLKQMSKKYFKKEGFLK